MRTTHPGRPLRDSDLEGPYRDLGSVFFGLYERSGGVIEGHAAGAGDLIELPGALPENDTPPFVGLQFTYARSTNILRRSACPVSERSAGPRISRSSLPH